MARNLEWLLLTLLSDNITSEWEFALLANKVVNILEMRTSSGQPTVQSIGLILRRLPTGLNIVQQVLPSFFPGVEQVVLMKRCQHELGLAIRNRGATRPPSSIVNSDGEISYCHCECRQDEGDEESAKEVFAGIPCHALGLSTTKAILDALGGDLRLAFRFGNQGCILLFARGVLTAVRVPGYAELVGFFDNRLFFGLGCGIFLVHGVVLVCNTFFFFSSSWFVCLLQEVYLVYGNILSYLICCVCSHIL
mmetsp:Transcript_69369/g.104628  ORF Transcript_69369/g.104628 Transcript_69369/m.104628 type:complete len:250 (-) Transcript_69369:69-818(-)